jgi:hypothetical protein
MYGHLYILFINVSTTVSFCHFSFDYCLSFFFWLLFVFFLLTIVCLFSFDYCLSFFFWLLFVFFPFDIVLSVLRFTTSDYPFDIFKFFLRSEWTSGLCQQFDCYIRWIALRFALYSLRYVHYFSSCNFRSFTSAVHWFVVGNNVKCGVVTLSANRFTILRRIMTVTQIKDVH